MPRARRPKIDASESRSCGASLGDLLRSAGLAGDPAAGETRDAGEGEAEAAPPTPTPAAPLLSCCARVVVSRERKGRHGKEVTLVTGLEALGSAQIEALAATLRRRLGCGAGVESDHLVLQGDQRARIEPLLRAEGARAVLVR